VWNYGHTTIPRHLRDIVVTEYGIADLRGRTDSEVIIALLNVADSRFQDELLAKAKAAGKVARDYRIPQAYRDNTPQRLEAALERHRAGGFFSEYPFGTDLTAEEIVLARALKGLQARTTTRSGKLRAVLGALLSGNPPEAHRAFLKRMGLDSPATFGERVLQRLVSRALRDSPL
jgi:hypothetical protein